MGTNEVGNRTKMLLCAGAVAMLIGAGSLFASATSSGATAEADTPSDAYTQVTAKGIERPLVVLYGDSLAWEAQDHFVATLAQVPSAHVITRTFGGTAICDWLDAMRADAVELMPGAVVVEFSGNALTACMQNSIGEALTRDSYLARYQADAETVIDIFEPVGTRIYFAGAPTPRRTDEPGDFNGGRLNTLYEQLADAHSSTVEFIDAGAAVLDQGRWTGTLRCLPDEPCEGGTDGSGQGVNAVRAPDGNHFCPAGEEARRGVTGACPVWSSGAFRFAAAMAAPVVEAFTA